jgi:8-oxo-dGTP pyrophosphatase MutT (NUDIX family)
MHSVKVFFNHDCHLLISYIRPTQVGIYPQVIEQEQAVWDFRTDPSILWDTNVRHNILLLTGHVEQTLESLFEFAEGVVAAGGIVKNPQGETLIIFRRGYWDLPKGKVEPGEKIANAAVREVQEETGVSIHTRVDEVSQTYHCYELRGKHCIKETHWYPMTVATMNTPLKPQTTEDIEQAIWADHTLLLAYRESFYPMIADLLGLHTLIP